MLRALAHRGPDDEAVWREGAATLGHRRLSIVDLSPSGRQPMISSDGRHVIVLNGEIYNHRALRSQLSSPAVGQWRGSSDVEVLLEAISRWGVDEALRRSFGMFAFALWDRRDATLHLVRDRFGEKPLCYVQSPRGIAFASELTSLRRGVDCGDIAPDALAAFFGLGYVPAPLAMLSDVRKLPPASRLSWRRDAPGEPRLWWSMETLARAGRDARLTDDGSALEALDDAMRTVVGEHMMADVPVGVFLSGGIDSSLTAAVMQSLSSAPIRSFTMGFAAQGFDEAPAAAAVARHLGTEHAEHYVGDADALALVPTLGAVYDEPFADPSQIPTLLMSALARRRVKVCLSGDGGDEMFGGYVRYEGVPRLWRVLARWPHAVRGAAAWTLERAPLGLLDRGLAPLRPIAKQYSSRGRIGDDVRRFARWSGAKTVEDLYDRTLGVWRAGAPLLGEHGRIPRGAPPPSWLGPLEAMQWRDVHGYLPGDILVKVDRAAMRHGLEARAPLLDERIARLAWRLPESLKRRDGCGKLILRRLLGRYLPQKLIERPKLGFTPPLRAWLIGPLRDWAEALIGPAAVRDAPMLDSGRVARTWRRFFAGDGSLDHHVWTVLMFQAWRTAGHSGVVAQADPPGTEPCVLQ